MFDMRLLLILVSVLSIKTRQRYETQYFPPFGFSDNL